MGNRITTAAPGSAACRPARRNTKEAFMKNRLVFPLFALALFSALFLAFASLAQAQSQAAPQTMAMSSQQQAILAEAWTLTPQRTAKAGFTDMPLRNCEGLYCGVLAKMPIGTPVEVLVDDRGGWALVHVPSLNMYGWVNTNNIFQWTCGPALF
jgi:hypothetical protein